MNRVNRLVARASFITPIVVIAGFVIVEVLHLTNVMAIGNLDYFPLLDRGLQLSFHSWNGWVDWIHPVGYPWLVRIGLELGFDAARWGQTLSVFGGVLGLIGTYLLAWSITRSRKVALLAEIFVATTGYFVFFAGQEGNDMLAAGFQILSIGWLALAIARAPIDGAPSARWIFLTGLTVGLAYLTRYTGMITAGVCALMLTGLALLQRRRSMWKLVAVFLITVIAVTALQWLPSWIVTGSPLSSDQGKNVYFHLYGSFDFITDWNAQPDRISLLQVIALDPGRFLRHWWDNFQSFWFSPKTMILDVPLKLFGQAGFIFMLLLGKTIRSSLRVLLALFILAHLAALSMLRLDPRFLLILVPLLVIGALYFFLSIVPYRWSLRRFHLPLHAPMAMIAVAFALPIVIGYASDRPATPAYLIEASDVLHAAGMNTANEVLSTDLRLQDLSSFSRQRFTQANDLRTMPHATLAQYLDSARGQGFRFLIYDKDTGPKLFPNLKDLLAPENHPNGLTPIYIELHQEFAIYRVEGQAATVDPSFAQFERGIALLRYEITTSHPVTATTSRNVGLFLSWQAERPVSLSYKVFVHVVDDGGQVVAQDDSLPVLWLYPTSDWKVGETVVDFHQIRVANVDPNKKYTAIVGLYDEATGVRLNQVDRNGRTIDDQIVLQPLMFK